VTEPQSTAATPETSDIRDYLRPVLSRWPLIMLMVAIVAAAAYWKASNEPKRYRATTSVLLSNNSGIESVLFGSPSFSDPERFAKNQAALLTSRRFASRVADRLKFNGNPAVLLSGLAITPAADSDFIFITSTTGNPLVSARVANGFAAEFVEMRTNALVGQARKARRQAERQIQGPSASTLSDVQRQTLQEKIDRLELIEAFPSSNAEQLDKALPPGPNASASPRQQAIFAGAIALVFGIALCFGLEALDRRLRRREDVEAQYRMPILADVPRVRDPVASEDGMAIVSPEVREAFRGLRTNLQLGELTSRNDDGGALRKILVTSAIASEGKSTIVRNLAITYREAGLRVAVVDADLRSPDLARMFGVEPRQGVLDVLTGSSSLEDALQTASLRTEGLDTIRLLREADRHAGLNYGNGNGNGHHEEQAELSLLTSDLPPADPASVLASARFQTLLDDLAGFHDLVLIDSAPLLPVSDTVPLLSVVDGVLLVARLGYTTRNAAKRACEIALRASPTPIEGVVVNDALEGEHNQAYVSYHYGLEHSEPSGSRKLLRR
jgi:Mrp family chromosome partitioning ATPase/capsular polysaccharide biosynthesis protein